MQAIATQSKLEKVKYPLGFTEGYKGDVKQFASWLATTGEALTLENLEPALTGYHSTLKDKYRPATINRKLYALQSYLLAAYGKTTGQKALIKAVFQTFKKAKVKREVLDHEVLTPKELERMLRRCTPKTRATIEALYESACRVSELAHLKLTDCTIKGDVAYCRVLGKGNKERVVFIPSKIFYRLKELYAGKTYLIEHEGHPVAITTIHKAVKRAGRKIGYNGLHPHLLRHAKATHLLKESVTLPAVSKYLGHANKSTTADYYLHDTPTAETVLQSYFKIA